MEIFNYKMLMITSVTRNTYLCYHLSKLQNISLIYYVPMDTVSQIFIAYVHSREEDRNALKILTGKSIGKRP